MAPRRAVRAGCLLLALALAVWPVYHFFWRYQLKRFQVVRPGVLYRSGQPTEFGLAHLAQREGVKTVLSLQMFDPLLYRGCFDPGRADGARETSYLASLGVRLVQWPLGGEGYWPWITPWQFEAFFRLLDEPANLPLAMHCSGGRHRTGTLAALYRLEYDRWPIERALDEMYSFSFGRPIPLQEYNLRSYVPRPRPDPAEWQALRQAFSKVQGPAAEDYASLVRRLRMTRGSPATRRAIDTYLRHDGPFALPLAQRLVDDPADPLALLAASQAAKCLERRHAPPHDWLAAAALVADFGTPGQQSSLLALLKSAGRGGAVTPRYAAIVSGINSRYTRNRLPFLRVVLDDVRWCPQPALRDCRFCDVAVAHILAITDERSMGDQPIRVAWDAARGQIRHWFDRHPEAVQLSRLIPAENQSTVMVTDGRGEDEENLLIHRR
ncbi:MAG TPA: tyrosine-protein phosphatase [Pirellulales bacterium]